MKRVLLPHQRKKLKTPIGVIVPREKAFKKNEKVIVVGDKSLFHALSNGKEPHIGVYDNKIKRMDVENPIKKRIQEWNVEKTNVKNEPGTISLEAMERIKQVLEKGKKAKIEVEGEEDLLVLPFILHSENGTLIYYGQPEEGIVEVRVSQELKEKVKKMLEEMPVES